LVDQDHFGGWFSEAQEGIEFGLIQRQDVLADDYGSFLVDSIELDYLLGFVVVFKRFGILATL
jgi:hypothetical protein